MLFFRIAAILFLGSVLFLSCTRHVERQVMDYQDAMNMKLPEWECHQVYDIKQDSLQGKSFLEVKAFPENKYPGISMGWLNGDWTRFHTLRITARTRCGMPLSFTLSIWDGKGTYDIKNRFQKAYTVDTGWTTCELPVQGGMLKPNGRETDIRRIAQVVFFTSRRTTATVFDIKIVGLQ
jgi:hypothetical protein